MSNEILKRSPKQKFIEIDHHPRVEKVSDIELRIPERVSTTEIIYLLFKGNNLKIDREQADCLLTGILTDSANFFHSQTTSTSIQIASDLFKKGANFSRITEKIFSNKDVSSIKIWSVVFNKLKVNQKYKIAYVVLAYDDLGDMPGNKEEALDALKGFLNNLQDIKALLFLREAEKGVIRGNLRTNREDVDVAKLAGKLGGGGHKKAAGFIASGTFKKVSGKWRVE